MPCDFVFLLHLTASLASVSVSFVTVRLNVSLIILGKLPVLLYRPLFQTILTNSALKCAQDRGFLKRPRTSVGLAKWNYVKQGPRLARPCKPIVSAESWYVWWVVELGPFWWLLLPGQQAALHGPWCVAITHFTLPSEVRIGERNFIYLSWICDELG